MNRNARFWAITGIVGLVLAVAWLIQAYFFKRREVVPGVSLEAMETYAKYKETNPTQPHSFVFRLGRPTLDKAIQIIKIKDFIALKEFGDWRVPKENPWNIPAGKIVEKVLGNAGSSQYQKDGAWVFTDPKAKVDCARVLIVADDSFALPGSKMETVPFDSGGKIEVHLYDRFLKSQVKESWSVVPVGRYRILISYWGRDLEPQFIPEQIEDSISYLSESLRQTQRNQARQN